MLDPPLISHLMSITVLWFSFSFPTITISCRFRLGGRELLGWIYEPICVVFFIIGIDWNQLSVPQLMLFALITTINCHLSPPPFICSMKSEVEGGVYTQILVLHYSRWCIILRFHLPPVLRSTLDFTYGNYDLLLFQWEGTQQSLRVTEITQVYD